MGAGQGDGQCEQVRRGNFWKREGIRGAQVHCVWKGCFFARMTSVLDCTRFSGATFKQYKLITGENLGRSTGHVYRQMPNAENVAGAAGGDGEGDSKEE